MLSLVVGWLSRRLRHQRHKQSSYIALSTELVVSCGTQQNIFDTIMIEQPLMAVVVAATRGEEKGVRVSRRCLQKY